MEQVQFSDLVANRGEGPRSVPRSRAVNVANVTQVQEDVLLTLSQQLLHGVPQHRAALAQFDTSSQINDCDASTKGTLAFI